MDKEEVCLAPHSPEWAVKFARERRRLTALLAAYTPEIEHIGSSAIEGLDAKPIIDIAVKVADIDLIPELTELLCADSYRYMGEYGLPGRHFYIKGCPREFHVHIVAGDSDDWNLWLRFRDILRKNPEVTRRYQALKRELVAKYHSDRRKYTASKTAFVNSILGVQQPVRTGAQRLPVA